MPGLFSRLEGAFVCCWAVLLLLGEEALGALCLMPDSPQDFSKSRSPSW